MSRHRLCICSFCLFNSIFLGSLLSLLIFWLIFLPKEPNFVTNATLTQFDFTNATNTLHYNLALNITMRNPNRWVGFYYNCIEAIANSRLKRFALVTLTSTPFYQAHKNTTILKQVFLEGQGEVVFGQNDISNFNSETAAGVYNIDIQLAVKVSVKFGELKTSYYTPSRKINCKLKVPSNVNETSADGFNITKCGNVTTTSQIAVSHSFQHNYQKLLQSSIENPLPPRASA